MNATAVSSVLVPSKNLAEAVKNSRTVFRLWLRQVPHILKDHEIPDITVEQGRRKVREEFLKNQHVKDSMVVDALVFRARQELQETVAHWKQKAHVLRYFLNDSKPTQTSDFLSKFYAGKD